MKSLRRRSYFSICVLFYLNDGLVFCQNLAKGGGALLTGPNFESYPKVNENRGSPAPQLMNILLTVAAANGVLPEILPTLKASISPDQLLQSELPSYSVGKSQSLTNFNLVSPSYMFPVLSHASGIISPTIVPPVMIPAHFISSPILPPTMTSPGMSLQNYPFAAPSTDGIYPFPMNLQQQMNTIGSYLPIKPTATSNVNRLLPNIQISALPPVQTLDNIATKLVDSTTSVNTESTIQQSTSTVEESVQQLPFNLEINVPPPSVAPKVRVLTSVPSTYPPLCMAPYLPNMPMFGGYPSFLMPPIIVEKSKSSLKSLLPIILITMLGSGRWNRGSGSCCYCRPGNYRSSGSNILIPYPIPIPINNPVITDGSSPYSSPNKQSINSDEE